MKVPASQAVLLWSATVQRCRQDGSITGSAACQHTHFAVRLHTLHSHACRHVLAPVQLHRVPSDLRDYASLDAFPGSPAFNQMMMSLPGNPAHHQPLLRQDGSLGSLGPLLDVGGTSGNFLSELASLQGGELSSPMDIGVKQEDMVRASPPTLLPACILQTASVCASLYVHHMRCLSLPKFSWHLPESASAHLHFLRRRRRGDR